MTSQQNLVADAGTVANFKSWGQAISTFFAAAGWVKATDTGQVDWTTIASVPASGNYVYEIWKPGDALTVFYLKLEYGYNNNPHTALSLGIATNGAGTLTGQFTPRTLCAGSPAASPSGSTLYKCFFGGSPSRMGIAMWAGTFAAQFFGIERSVDATGAYTGSYVTLWVLGNVGFGSITGQQSLSLTGLGAAGQMPESGGNNGWAVRTFNTGFGTTFNNSIAIDLCAPQVGYFDYPCTVCGCANRNDLADQVTFETTLYGGTHTYMPIKGTIFDNVNLQQCCLLLRWE